MQQHKRSCKAQHSPYVSYRHFVFTQIISSASLELLSGIPLLPAANTTAFSTVHTLFQSWNSSRGVCSAPFLYALGRDIYCPFCDRHFSGEANYEGHLVVQFCPQDTDGPRDACRAQALHHPEIVDLMSDNGENEAEVGPSGIGGSIEPVDD